MKQPTAIELLTAKLEELKKARQKSLISFEKGEITEEEYDMHMENLTPIIEDYTYTIRVINQYK